MHPSSTLYKCSVQLISIKTINQTETLYPLSYARTRIGLHSFNTHKFDELGKLN